MLGFNVIRFTNKQVLSETDYTINTILLELKKEKPEISDSEAPPAEGFGEAGPVFISLPGVPHEMKGLMMDEVIPFILKEYDLPAIVHKTAFTAGIGESMLAEMLKEFEPSLPSHIKLAYLPNYGMVKLRLTTTGNNKEEVEKELLPLFEKMMKKAKGKTMGTAESCTGGYIAHLITAIPGSSIYYNGSVVSYSYETKENILGVKKETLEKTGAVSEETVTEMAKGAIKTLNVDYVVAVSGIMGPEGGTEDKPVGTVWIAVADKNKVETTVLHLRFDRQRNIEMTAANALNFLRKFILKN
ncbi:MAG: nicotinamide-nucleotide amidohydrolase family protein [Chitinophagaceae bacterium]|nr:nicotinamide-nucleotide amidohydrolase family protein [Chitinophagaceae bacterium]